MKRRWFTGFVATIMLSLSLTACGDTTSKETVEQAVQQGTTVEEATEKAEQSAENEEESTTPRYQPEWTKDAVVYEVNVRQYTQEGTFQAPSVPVSWGPIIP